MAGRPRTQEFNESTVSLLQQLKKDLNLQTDRELAETFNMSPQALHSLKLHDLSILTRGLIVKIKELSN